MDKQLLYQNKKIFYRIIGTGKPVILIHGFGEEAGIWNNQVRPPQTPHKEGLPTAQGQLTQHSSLSRNFKFIIPDLPGTGQSEMIDDMSMEGMAEVIKIILQTETSAKSIEEETLKPPKNETTSVVTETKNPPSATADKSGGREACIIGHSMGGYITLALVEKYPGLISAFGLFHSSAFADSEEKKATRRKGIEFIQQHGAFEFLKTSTPNLFSPLTKDENPELIGKQIAGLDNFLSASLVSYYEQMMKRPDRTEVLRKAAVPVLFIMGKYDAAVPVEDGLKQCHLPEKSYIHILHQSGHMGMLEEADKCKTILNNFLEAL